MALTFDPFANGSSQFATMIWEDKLLFSFGLDFKTNRLVLVSGPTIPSTAVEVWAFNPTTGIITQTNGVFTVGFQVPQYTVATLPAAGQTQGQLVVTTDDHNLRFWNGSAWTVVGGSSGTVSNSGTLTNSAVILGNGGTVIRALGSLGTTTTVLHGNAAGDPSFGAVVLTTDVSGTLPAGNGGIGVASPTAHTLPVAEGASAMTFLGPLTNGQLLIGSTGADPVAASLTAGSGISITPGAGSISIAATAVGAVTVFDRAYNATITNTTVETTIYTKSVAGNTLGATGKFRVTMTGQYAWVSATANTLTLRFKFGGTTLIALAIILTDGTSTGGTRTFPFKTVFELANLNATNSQEGNMIITGGQDRDEAAAATAAIHRLSVFSPVGAAAGTLGHDEARGTSAIDTTSSQTLLITGQYVAANAANVFTASVITVEQL